LEAKAPLPFSLHCRYLQIAAVTIAISHDHFINLHNQDPIYRSFFDAADAEKNNSQIQVRLVLGKMPDLSRLQKLFDTRASWSIYGDARGFWLSFHPALHHHPFWIARFDRQARRVIVYCGSQLAVPGGNKNDLANPICYPLDQLLFMYHLAYCDGVLVHAAGSDLAGRGLIFPGCSGAGKSTLARLFVDCRIGKLLSDERVIVRQTGAGWQVYGTPWAGTEDIASNSYAPLSGMFFLKHGKCNHLQALTAENALERLLPILSIPWYDSEVMSRIVIFAKHLVANVPAYEMSFKPDRSAVDFFLQFQNSQS
jgi:hypothetical protein